MLHTTLVLSIVLSFWLLNRDFPPNNPSASIFHLHGPSTIFNYRSGSQTFSVIPPFEQGGLFKPHLSLIAPIKWYAKPPTYRLHCPRGHRFKSGLMSYLS